MAKKLKELAQDSELTDAVRNSAQQIWQAGLGAFAKAQQEGGRVFSKLVKEGSAFQQRAEEKAAGVGGTFSDTVSKIADGVGKQASGSWDKLEQVFEERVARALATIGVPTQGEIAALHERIDQLSRQVAALSGAKPAAKTARKPAAKPVAKSKAATKVTAKPAVTARAKPAARPATRPAARKKSTDD